MTEYKTEEEQVEQLKNWWKQHGNTVITSVSLVCIVWFGTRYWQSEQKKEAEAASSKYSELLEAVLVNEPTETQQKTAQHLAETLRSEYSGSSYAQFAALFSAKALVENGDLPKAEEELQWVLEQKPHDELKLITQLRLAKVFLGQDKFDDALAQLVGAEGTTFEASFAETKGDVHYAKGEHEDARLAYQQADLIAKGKGERRPNLKMKIDSLTVADSSSVSTAKPDVNANNSGTLQPNAEGDAQTNNEKNDGAQVNQSTETQEPKEGDV